MTASHVLIHRVSCLPPTVSVTVSTTTLQLHRVKFGAFVEYLQQEHAGSFDRIASGHYAKVQRRGAGAVDAVDGASDSNGSSSSTCQSQPPQQHAGADAASANDASSSPDGVEVAAALSERQSSHALASSSSNGSSSHSHPQRPRPNRLLMVPDAVKDQTYFLANLSPSQLATCMFPLGSFTKPQVSGREGRGVNNLK